MPYKTVSDLPSQTDSLTIEQKRRFLKAFNAAHEAGKGEKSAFKIAWSAANDEVSKSKTVTVQEHERTKDGETHTVEEHQRKVSGSSDGESSGSSDESWTDSKAGEFVKNLLIATAIIAGAGAAGRVMRYAAPRLQPFNRANTFEEANRLFARNTQTRRLSDLVDTPPLTGQRGTIDPRDIRGLQGRTYNETLSNVERSIQGSRRELGFIIDDKGKIVSGLFGDGHNVPVPAPMRMPRRTRGSYTFTHNHPVEVPLSGADLAVQEMFGFGTMRAVLPSGAVSRMTYNAQPTNIAGQVQGSYQTTNMLRGQMNYLRKNGVIDPTMIGRPRIAKPYSAHVNRQYETMARRNPQTWNYEMRQGVYPASTTTRPQPLGGRTGQEVWEEMLSATRQAGGPS